MSDTIIRVAAQVHAPAIIDFLSRPEIDGLFHAPLSQRDISIQERVLSKFITGFWVVALTEDGEVVGCRGCSGLAPDGRTAVLSTMVVDPDRQGEGLAGRMVRLTLQTILERYPDATSIWVDIASTSTGAARLFEALGFAKMRAYAEPRKRPPGVLTVEYQLATTELDPAQLGVLGTASPRRH